MTVVTCPSKPNGSITRPTTTYQNQVEPELERNQCLELGFRRRLAASDECLSDAAVGEEISEDPHGRAKGDETEVVRRQKPRSHERSEESDDPDPHAAQRVDHGARHGPTPHFWRTQLIVSGAQC